MAYSYTTYSQFEQDLAALDTNIQVTRSFIEGGAAPWIANQQELNDLIAQRNAMIAAYESARAAQGAPSPTPPTGMPSATPAPDPTTFSVKQPAPSLVQYAPETLPQELIEDLLYEQVGGQELISIARHDTINGQDVSYSLIRNLSILNQNFNPNNILAGQTTYTLQFNQYALDIANKLISASPIYLDDQKNLVIELDSIGADEYLEAEISTNGTIYKLETEQFVG